MKKNNVNVIGLCGAARSGKDTFFEYAKEHFAESGIRSMRLAFADELKKDLFPFLSKKMGINPFAVSDKEKTLIRPILVAYGEAMREMSKGKYWIEKLAPKLNQNIKRGVLSIVTDVRYPNEVKWINEFEGSKCIYIERDGILPANTEEEKNDPKLRSMAEEILKWKTFGDSELFKCKPVVNRVLKKLHEI